MIKVYATVEVKNNLITTIPFKGVKVHVEFTGGNSMKNIPAKFYARDPFTIKALDSCDQLGRLYYVHQTIKEEDDDQPQESGTVGSQAENGQKVHGEAEGLSAELVGGQAENGLKMHGEAEGLPAGGAGIAEGAEAGEKKLEFANLGEAITYIAAHYGEQVETESAARKLLEEKEGVKPVIHKG